MVWPRVYGANQVFCSGRFISGPDAHNVVFTIGLIVAPSTAWLIWVGHFFTTRFSVVFVVIAVILQGSSLAFLVAAAMSDPGIMPRQEEQRWDDNNKVLRTRRPAKMHDVILRGHRYKLKYCDTCNIYRPPRCVHCSICENCIERFDHHCVWVGNCIGKRNYWMFYSFLTITGMLNSYTLATAMVQILLLHQEFQDFEEMDDSAALAKAVLSVPVSGALVLYCVGSVWFTVGLCVYHNYLICMNQTTYEQLKEAYPNTNKNPFHRGIIGNYKDMLFSRIRPRYFDACTGESRWPHACLPPPEAASPSTLEQGEEKTPREEKDPGAKSSGFAQHKHLIEYG